MNIAGKKILTTNTWFCYLFFFGFLIISCGEGVDQDSPDQYDRGTIHISADESFKNVIDEQVKVYECSYPDTKIIVHYKPEAECFKDFGVDSIRMIIATRGYSAEEK